MGEAAAALAGTLAEIEDCRIGAHLFGDAVAHRLEPALRARLADGARPQSLGRIDRIGKDMQPHRRRIRLGRIAGEFQRLLHHLLDMRFDLGERLGIGDAIILDQPLAEHVDRVALDPGVELLLRPIGADDRIAFVMSDGAVGLGLDQRRALAGAGALGRFLHGQPDCEDVVAVDCDARHAVGLRPWWRSPG